MAFCLCNVGFWFSRYKASDRTFWTIVILLIYSSLNYLLLNQTSAKTAKSQNKMKLEVKCLLENAKEWS